MNNSRKNTRKMDFYCRLCRCKITSDLMFYDLYNRDENIFKTFPKHLVEKRDGFPGKICGTCFFKMQYFDKFITVALESHQFFLEKANAKKRKVAAITRMKLEKAEHNHSSKNNVAAAGRTAQMKAPTYHDPISEQYQPLYYLQPAANQSGRPILVYPAPSQQYVSSESKPYYQTTSQQPCLFVPTEPPRQPVDPYRLPSTSRTYCRPYPPTDIPSHLTEWEPPQEHIDPYYLPSTSRTYCRPYPPTDIPSHLTKWEPPQEHIDPYYLPSTSRTYCRPYPPTDIPSRLTEWEPPRQPVDPCCLPSTSKAYHPPTDIPLNALESEPPREHVDSYYLPSTSGTFPFPQIPLNLSQKPPFVPPSCTITSQEQLNIVPTQNLTPHRELVQDVPQAIATLKQELSTSQECQNIAQESQDINNQDVPQAIATLKQELSTSQECQNIAQESQDINNQDVPQAISTRKPEPSTSQNIAQHVNNQSTPEKTQSCSPEPIQTPYLEDGFGMDTNQCQLCREILPKDKLPMLHYFEKHSRNHDQDKV